MRDEKKKNYEKPVIDVITVQNEDIVTISGFKDWEDIPEGDD